MGTHQEDARPERNMIVRVPTQLYREVQRIAATEQRTLSAEVRWLMVRRVREVAELQKEAA